jgi:hypothetical protein
MTLNDNAVVIPGRGTVLYATPGTAFTEDDLDELDLDAVTPVITAGYTWLGHTSSDNNVSLSKSGGEKTTKGSWWNKALRVSTTPIDWDVTVNSLQVDAATLALAFPGGSLNGTTGVFEVPDSVGTVDKAVVVYIQDGAQHMALWWPKLSLSLGDAPSIDPENFFEIQLAGRSLSVSGKRMGIIPPRPIPA